jgi:imidazolonepropionase-like amidohydrolase
VRIYLIPFTAQCHPSRYAGLLRVLVALLWSLSLSAAVVIRDVAVVDVQSADVRPHRNVVIEGERIASIGPNIPAAARVIDGHGRFLIPGLWDMHVHLGDGANVLPSYVAQGITGVQDFGSPYEQVARWRIAVDSGKAVGPHVLASGPVVDAANPAGARQAFDKLWDLDVDHIAVSGGIPRDAYFALAEQARHWELRFIGPVPTSVTAWEAIQARQASIESMEGITKAVSSDTDALRFFEECAIYGVRLTPTLVKWLGTEHAEAIYRLTGLTTQTKVEVLAGSDSSDPGAIHGELEQLVAAGLSPHQALLAATLAPARFLGWDEAMGTIAKGKVADLVLLDANPLEDIRNTRRIAGVFVRGRYVRVGRR